MDKNKIVNILISIDTERVKERCEDPSKDDTSPTIIDSPDQEVGYMFATGTTINGGQGTGDLGFEVMVGDIVRFFAISGSNNWEDAVLLYDVQSDGVLGPFIHTKDKRMTPVPASEGTVLPAGFAERTFWFHEAEVVKEGANVVKEEPYKVRFSLYARGDDGRHELVGCYEWRPAVRIQIEPCAQ